MGIINSHYKYKDNYYAAISTCKLKHPMTGEWSEAILYVRLNNQRFISGKGIYPEPNLPNFCREAQDFYSKFEKVNFEESKNG